jgi:hypothetical protein
VIIGSRFLLLLLHCGPFLMPAPADAQSGPQETVLQLSAASYTASEGAGSIAVTITRTGRLDTTVGVTLTTLNSTAIAGSDYTAVSTTVVFSGAYGMPTRTVSIPIVDDAIGEHRESLLVMLSAPTGGATLGGLPFAPLNIDDDDPPTVAPTLSVDAGNPRQLRLSWTPVPGATSITSYYSSHPRFPFSVLGTHSGLSTFANHDISVHRYPWTAGPRYKVSACNAYGCVESNAAGVPAGAMLDAIGYIKPRHPTAYDDFGYAVALSADGTTLAVGAPREPARNAMGYFELPWGAVFVFKRQPSGEWLEEARLKALAYDSQKFGSSVALSSNGDTLVIGATGDHSGSAGVDGDPHDHSMPYAGAAHVFTRAGAQWSRQAYLKASFPDSSAEFGYSVAVSADGNTVAVGEPFDDAGGAAHVFVRSGSQWTMHGQVQGSNTEAGDDFGVSVALSADGATLAVGARSESSSATGSHGASDAECNNNLSNAGCNNDAPGAGAAYVFTRAGVNWSAQAYIKASNTDQPGTVGVEDQFGYVLALSADGNTLAVGAPGEESGNGNESNNDAAEAGAVYVYTRAGGQWSQPTYVKAITAHQLDKFGSHVALSGNGNWLAVGAPEENHVAVGVVQPPQPATPLFDVVPIGAVYLYQKSLNPAGWAYSKYLKASNAQLGDSFGSVALDADGRTIAVGAPGEDSLDPARRSDDSGWLPPPHMHAPGAVYLY